MTIDKCLPKALLRENIDTLRRARLFLYAVIITSTAAISAAALMFALGIFGTGLTIVYATLGQLVSVVLLFVTRSVAIASHFLLAAIMAMVVMDLGPTSDFSILALSAIPIIAINLLGMRVGIIWSIAAIVWAIAINPWMLGGNQFFSILSVGVGITTMGLAAAALVIEHSRAKAVDEAETATEREQNQRERIWMFAEQTFPGIAEVRNGVFEYVNPGLCALLGYSDKEIMDIHTATLIHPDDYTDIFNTLVGVSRDGFRIEARVRHAQGHWIWLELYGIPYGTPSEDCWIIATHDYTDIKQSREKMLQAQRLEGVGVLAAGVAHDFNNLLTVIMGFGALLPSSLERKEILKAAHDASELTSQLTAFGQRGPTAVNSIDAVQAIKNLRDLFESLLGERLKLTLNLDDVPLGIKINNNQFNQIALNLVKNAKESIFNSGQVIIKVHCVDLSTAEALALSLARGKYVLISVTDTGIGMSEKAAERAFDPFYSTKQPGEGSGLGLASTYGIVTQNGGNIRLDSKPGEGTTISLYFPLTQLGSQPNQLTNITRTNPQNLSLDILVVDDESTILSLVKRVLTDAGHKVTTAGNADDAFAVFKAKPIDLLISDIVMPGMRGTELMERFRHQQPELPALLISGYTDDEVNLWLDSDTTTRFLAKPFRGEELLSQVNKLTDTSATV